MSDQSLAAEQLIELLLQLKKAGPDAAKQILNSQPQIAYALITLMVNMNAINFEVFQKTLATFGGNPMSDALQQSAAFPQAQPPAPAPPPAGPSAIPPHVQSQAHPYYRTSTPPTSTPPSYPTPHPNGYGHPPAAVPQHAVQSYAPPPAQSVPSYGQPHAQGYPPHAPSYGHPPPAAPVAPAASVPAPSLADSLAGMSEEQKAMITRVITMTPEQINMLPPTDRANIIQLRATLGIPS